MNFFKFKKKTKKSNLLLRYLCSFASIATLINTPMIHPAYAQIDPSLASCHITNNAGDIDLGDVNPITNPQSLIMRRINIECTTRGYHGEGGTKGYYPYANYCLGIVSASGPDTGTSVKKLYRQTGNGGFDPNNSLNFEINNMLGGRTQAIGTGAIGGGYPLIASTIGLSFPASEAQLLHTVNSTSWVGMELLQPPILNIPVGQYSNTFNYVLYSGVALPNGGIQPGPTPDSSGGCVASFGAPQTISFTVTANVVAGCSMTLTNINFGEHIGISSDLAMSGAVNLRCNVNAPYEVQIDGGKSGDINARKMYFVGTNNIEDRSKAIPYHIYLPNTQTEWGITKGSNSYQGVTTANDTSIPVKAVIRASEVRNPASGTYKDTLVVTTIF